MNETEIGDRRIMIREDREPSQQYRGPGRRDRSPSGRGDERMRDGDRAPTSGPPGGARGRAKDDPALEKKMDDDLDNYFANRPQDDENQAPKED